MVAQLLCTSSDRESCYVSSDRPDLDTPFQASLQDLVSDFLGRVTDWEVLAVSKLTGQRDTHVIRAFKPTDQPQECLKQCKQPRALAVLLQVFLSAMSTMTYVKRVTAEHS